MSLIVGSNEHLLNLTGVCAAKACSEVSFYSLFTASVVCNVASMSLTGLSQSTIKVNLHSDKHKRVLGMA